jgi:Tfp pilus assembly protein PilF
MKTTGSWRALALALALAGILLAAGAPRANADGSNTPSRGAAAAPEDPDYTAAVQAIKGVVARDGSNADAYNWLGYATRRNGDAARAVALYEKALAIDPKHRGAHEYIGEAYLVLGDLAKAKAHLARLDALCFFSCEEYRDLKRAIERYEASGGAAKP